MPIYEYECDQCGKQLEVFQKISEKPLTKCSNCSGKLHKLVSQSSFHLKGSGWYATDYAKKSGTSTTSTPKKKGDTETASTQKSSDTGDKT